MATCEALHARGALGGAGAARVRYKPRGMSLHPAEERGYRELFGSAREAEGRLRRLSERLGNGATDPVAKAGAALGEMLAEVGPAAREADEGFELDAPAVGPRIGSVRSEILDPLLECNQALRYAVDDLEHITTLLGYLAAVAEGRGDEALPDVCRRWERKLRRHLSPVRKAAIEMGSDPDGAIELMDPDAEAAAKAALSGGGTAPIEGSAGPLRRLGLRR
mgnify:CR=1 FL=1